MRIDLHTHSNASDGTDAPADLVGAARAAGLAVVALTDHDTVAGWADAVAALPAELTLVRGAEISCTYAGISMHLLGYLFDPGHEELSATLERVRNDRIPRAREIARRLSAAGVPLTWEDVLGRVEPGATVGRPHIADALVAKGLVRDRTEAFDRYLHRGTPFYVPHYALDPTQAVRLVRAADGVAVMAHPGAHRRGRVVPDEGIAAMAEAGLAGLEVDHPDHDEATRERLRGLAGELGLLTTGSSDYHGTGKVNRLGQETTDPEVYAALTAQAAGATPVAA